MQQKGARRALLLSVLIIIMDASAGATSFENISEITFDDNEGASCNESWCRSDKISHPYAPSDAGLPVEAYGWWESYGRDSDSDGMDDRLERILDGESESISPTAIMGPDGRKTVAIVVDYAWHPGVSDSQSLKDVLQEHGWIEDGAWFFQMDSLDSIVLDKVPVSSLPDILSLPGVVLIEQQNVLEPYLGTATKASKVRSSEIYPDSFWSNGYMGDGVVIAILDTGVDNEHFSLDDFSDSNTDNTNEPSDLPDPKWVAGCDATSQNQGDCTDGNFDPDDGDGHGTHVAGIALGTGDSDRDHIGYAPGAYLVDVKVFNDIGTTNSAAILKGINWVTNNADTDWGNNESSRGIDVMSMSFGTRDTTTPGEEDQGDDGQNAEARAVDAAVDAGIVAVAAIGNDGKNRITSVGASDKAITVGAIDERDTIDRADDLVDSYSNYGPRADDGDNDVDDEHKPDVVAPGSGIMSAEYSPPNPLPVGDEQLADDGYTEKSGTSMACPAVAGLAALILSYDDTLSPQDVKTIIRVTSEQRGAPSDSENSDRWNNQYGYGIVDGEQIYSCLIGGDCAQIQTGEEWIYIDSPAEDDWVIQGKNYSFSGTLNEDEEGTLSVEKVQIRTGYSYKKEKPGGQVELVKQESNWTNLSLDEDGRWTSIVSVPIIDVNGYYDARLSLEAKAMNETGRWGAVNRSFHGIGKIDLGLSLPEPGSKVSGLMELSGSYSTVDGGMIRWKIDDGEWFDGPSLSEVNKNRDEYTGEFDISIDTSDMEEGERSIQVRLESGDGLLSEIDRRTVEVDNLPPRPNLIVMDGSVVTDYGIPIDEARVGSFLEIRGEIRNEGDVGATGVMVSLYEDGQRRYEATIPKISVSEKAAFTLYWSPSVPGSKELSIVVDPLDTIEELDESDNLASLYFDVMPLKQGIDIVLVEGGIATSPVIPNPGDQFTLITMLRNDGNLDSSSIEATLHVKESGGWLPILSRSLSTIPAGQISMIEFPLSASTAGPMEYRITVSGPELVDEDWSSNEIEGVIVIDDSRVSSRLVSLSEDEEPLAVLAFRKTGLILTSEGTQIIMHKIEEDGTIVRCTTPLERFWSGSITATVDDSSIAHVVWTRRLVTGTGVLSETISYSTVDDQCTSTVPQDLMEPLPMNLGDYFGVDIDQQDDLVVIAGCLRDLSSGLAFEPLESVFTLHAEDPQSASDWELVVNVIEDIDTMSEPNVEIEVEIGEDLLHLLYTSSRSDTSSEDVLGLWYAHGILGGDSWTYKRAIAVEGNSPTMAVDKVNGEDRIAIGWIEGEGDSSVLRVVLVDESFSTINGASFSILARGANLATISERGGAFYLIHDSVGPLGPVASIGIIDPEEGWIGLENRISSGWIYGVSDRSDGLSLPYMQQTMAGSWSLVEVISNGDLDDGPSNIFERAKDSLGLDDTEFNVLLAGLATVMLVILLSLLVGTMRQGLTNISDRRRSASVVVEADPEDALEIDEDAVEEVSPMSIPPPKEIAVHEVPAPPVPVDPSNPFRTVTCKSCKTRFDLSKKVRRTSCPACGSRVEDI
jgi:subtilisin family serine protease